MSECGTNAGYQAHTRRGEPACEPCKAAHRQDAKRYNHQNPEKAAQYRRKAADQRITVPRPKPDEVLLAITDADGASCWTSCKKAHLGDIGPSLLPFLEEGQRMVHEQGDGTVGSHS
jgi:hypothetical protein